MTLSYVVPCVMLIDDNRIDNFIHRKLLEAAGFARQFVVVESAREALDYLRQAETLPDVILLDVQMPQADGFAFLNALEPTEAGRMRATDLYMLSSSLDQNDLHRARTHPLVKAFLSKPLNVQELICHQTEPVPLNKGTL